MQNKRMKFTTLSEQFQMAALAGAVYVPYACSRLLITGDEQALMRHLATVGAMFIALRLPLIQQVPLFLSRVLIMPLLMRGQRRDPELQAMVDEMLRQTGSGKKITAKTYERGITNNAMAFGREIFVGRELRNKLTDEELKFVVAHELSHIESHDVSERYLFWPPFVDGVLTGMTVAIATASYIVDGQVKGMADLAVTGMVLGAATAYAGTMAGVRYYHSRFGEYRADANALRLTGNVEAAKSALAAITGREYYAQPTAWQKFRSTHPIGHDRIEALEKVAATLPQPAAP